MKTYRFLYTGVIALFALGLNFNFSLRNSDVANNFSLSCFQHDALAEVEACVSFTYFNDDMKPCFNSVPCYDSQGQECGRQICCEYSALGSSCNETECF